MAMGESPDSFMPPQRPPGVSHHSERKEEINKLALFVCLVESGAGKAPHLVFVQGGEPTLKVGIAPVGEVPEEIWSWVTQSK